MLRHTGKFSSHFSIIKRCPASCHCFIKKDISKHEDKAELFNTFFAKQCSLINNSSVLPSVLFKWTANVISSSISGPNEAHGHDMTSISMLEICGDLVWTTGNSHLNGKKQMFLSANVCYPVSLGPISGKALEHLIIYNTLFEF